MGIGKLKCNKTYCSYQDSVIFVGHVSDCFRHLANFQSSEIVDFENFCQYSHCFYERVDFWISLLPSGSAFLHGYFF